MRSPHRARRILRRLGYGVAGLCGLGLLAAAAGFTYESIASRADRRLFPAPGRMVDVGGYRLHILCVGEGSPTVVLDSGLGSYSLYWGKVMSALRPHTRVCAVDRAGYGWSDPAPQPRTTLQISNELHTLLRNAAIPPPYVLAGWSFGGFTARMYAHRYPDEVAGVVLVDSAHEEQFVRFVPAVVGGIKTTGLNLEPVVRALGGPERTHTLVETTVTRLNWLKSRLGLARWARRHETAGGFWQDYPDGTFPRNRFCELQHGFLPAILGEQSAWEQSVSQIREVKNLGDLPLIVVSRAPDLKGPFPAWFPKLELERHWQEMQWQLAGLSTRGKLVLAAGSDHLVPHRRPDVIAAAVLELVRATRHRQTPPPA